jgi:hypothetical protein
VPYLPLAFPPGVYRNGTRYQAKGRWTNANLVRWSQGVMKPVGGWQKLGLGYDTATNIALRSYQINQAPWDVTGSMTRPVASSHYTDLTARRLLDPGSSATAHLAQDLGVFTDGPETLSVVMELVSSAGDVTDIEIYDVDAADPALRVNYDWTTGAVTVADTSEGGAEEVGVVQMGTGPNGGILVRLWGQVTPDNDGNDRQIRIYPSGIADADAADLVIHHVGYAESAGLGPVVFTTTDPVTQERGRVEVDGEPSGLIAWRDNGSVSRLALGTTHNAYAYAEGVTLDITPTSFTPGGSFAAGTSGLYGSGAYGTGLYGQGDLTLEALVEAQSWQFDNFGELLVALAYSDGKLYSWDLDDNNVLTAITNAPEDNSGLVVTPERFLVALGADGDGRKVQWADQETLTDWTPTTLNQAGDFLLPGVGSLLAGRRARTETLLWTTQDLFAMRYIGGTLIYSFTQVGSNCGPISRRAIGIVDGGRAFWMGNQSFFSYNGFAQPIPSSVVDYVFSDMNRQQSSKINCVVRAEHNEIIWYYCSAGSSYVDRYVTHNYAEQTWAIGTVGRTAGVDRGVFDHPISTDRYGVVYEEERGWLYPRYAGGVWAPYAISGPIEIETGDNIMYVRRIIPDEQTLGSVTMSLLSAFFPTAPESTFGPYTMTNPTATRLTGRQVRVRVDSVGSDWRFGEPRLEIVLGGLR